MTGPLILSTLHTNEAISSIGRLIDMGVEPSLLASVLEGALAQRLGRRVCPHCREQMPMPEDVSHRLSPSELELFNGSVWRGRGCTKCNDSGYHGRIGFFELVRVTAAPRRAVSEDRPAAAPQGAAHVSFINRRREWPEKAPPGPGSGPSRETCTYRRTRHPAGGSVPRHRSDERSAPAAFGSARAPPARARST